MESEKIDSIINNDIDKEIHIGWLFLDLLILVMLFLFIVIIIFFFFDNKKIMIIFLGIVDILIFWFIYYFWMNINNKLLYTKSIFNQIICYFLYLMLIILIIIFSFHFSIIFDKIYKNIIIKLWNQKK